MTTAAEAGQAGWVPGEWVNVTIPGAVVHEVDDGEQGLNAWLIVHYRYAGRECELHIPLDGKITIERDVPADGVPARGETWADRHGNRYFARMNDKQHVVLVPERDTGRPSSWLDWSDVHGDRDLGPIHRVAARPK